MMLLSQLSGAPAYLAAMRQLGEALVKQAGDPEPAYSLEGTLYLSKSGWVMLSVPNALVRCLCSEIKEPGVSLPLHDDGSLEAHISVFRPEELEQIGGADRLKHDRGKRFAYNIGRLETVVPENWKGVSRVWMLRVHSPALMELRRSYGLPGLPNQGKFAFHITVAIRRAGVLGRNDVSKLTAAADGHSVPDELELGRLLSQPLHDEPEQTPEPQHQA